MAKEVVMVPIEKYRKLMGNYEKETKNPSDKDVAINEKAIDLKVDAKNEDSDDGNKRCIEENKVRLDSFEDNDLNPSLNTKQSKEEKPDLDVISPSNEMKDEISSSEQIQLKTTPVGSPDFGVYKSVSAITKDHKRTVMRKRIVRKTWLKPI